MKEIKFNEDDLAGQSTLEVISQTDNFNQWMYSTIKPFCKGKVLEIGSGIGNISLFFIKDNYKIMLTDIREDYCSKLTAKFRQFTGFLRAEPMNLTDPDFDEKFAKYFGKYDTVFALNVVEHIYDDALSLNNCYKLLAKGGHIVILVPSYQLLFNQFDKELGHYRRYTKSSLSKVYSKTKFEIIHKQYFNFVGMFGWFISGNILKNKVIPNKQMKLYDLLVPIIKVIDKLVLNKLGLSTIVVGRK